MEKLIYHLLSMAAVTIFFIVLWLRPDYLQKLFLFIRRQVARLFFKKKDKRDSAFTVVDNPAPTDRDNVRYMEFERPDIGNTLFYFYFGGKRISQAKRRRILRRSNINQHKK